MKLRRIIIFGLIIGMFSLCFIRVAFADSFLTSVDFDIGKVSIPTSATIDEKIAFLDTNNDYFVHAQALGQFNTYELNQTLIDALKRRLNTSDSPLKEFDLGYALVYNAAYDWPVCANPKHFGIHNFTQECHTVKNELAKEGIKFLKTSLEKERNAAQLLIYALCLAQVEAFVLLRPWSKVTEEKKEVISIIKEAIELNNKNVVRGFDRTFKNAIDYMLLYNGYSSLRQYLPKGKGKE